MRPHSSLLVRQRWRAQGASSREGGGPGDDPNGGDAFVCVSGGLVTAFSSVVTIWSEAVVAVQGCGPAELPDAFERGSSLVVLAVRFFLDQQLLFQHWPFWKPGESRREARSPRHCETLSGKNDANSKCYRKPFFFMTKILEKVEIM
jgi:hypothetical protein